MRTTMNLDDELIKQVMKDAGVKEKTQAVHIALRNFVEAAAYERLAKLYGAFKGTKAPPRRRLAA